MEGADAYPIAVFAILVCCVGCLTALATLLISLLSWAFVPRWRTFKNYVFLNIVFSFNMIYFLPTLIISGYGITNNVTYISLDIVMNFFMFAACCWLMIMAMQVYTDLVKVFGNNMTRKYLKCNLFGWGLPFLVSVAKITNKVFVLTDPAVSQEKHLLLYNKIFYYEEIVQNLILILMLLVNLLVYIKVVWSLIRSPSVSKKLGQQLQVATIAFVMSGVLLLVSIVMTLLMLTGKKDLYYLYPLGLAIYGVQTIIINICFLRAKSTRNPWKQHYESKRKMKRDQNIVKLTFTETGSS